MSVKTFTTEVLTSADTNEYLANSGLVYVAGATFSGITSAAPLDVNSVFSSTYTNYRIVMRLSQTVASGSLYLRMRTVSTLNSTANYDYGWGGTYISAVPAYNFSGFATSNPFAPETFFYAGVSLGSGQEGCMTLDVLSPNAAAITRFLGQSAADYTGTYYNTSLTGAGRVNITTQYTGFRIYPTAGTLSGEYQVYGYRIA